MPVEPRREEEFPAAHPPRADDEIAVTVDVVALTIRDGRLHVLLVRRGVPPYVGRWALPGGFVRVADGEDLPGAAARELAEETGLTADERSLGRVHLEQLGTYGDPGRDPRLRVISIAHLAFAPRLPDPRAGSDAAEAAWTPTESLGEGHDLAFDHGRILADGLERARAKLEYTPLATTFCAPEFTIPELRRVYEAVWGRTLHAGNFHRKVNSVPGFIEPTGGSTGRGGRRGGPRARLYRPGGARLLHPALLRPSS